MRLCLKCTINNISLFVIAVFELLVRCENSESRRLQPKIINGFLVDITHFPFVGSLQVNGKHICGTAIVSEDILVTAAHCITLPADFYQIRIGSSYYDHGGIVLSISSISTHPKYNRSTADYDVAILKLNEKLSFDDINKIKLDSNDKIGKVALPDKDYSPLMNLGTIVLGWGTTERNDDTGTSLRLQSASQRVITMEKCKALFPPGAITETMLCGQNFYDGQDTCTGDSGGPMIARGQLIGIISWGIACADGSSPGVYTNVAKVVDFITTHHL